MWIVVDEARDLVRAPHDERVRGSSVVLVRGFERRAHAADQPIDIREPVAFDVQTFGLVGLDRESFELVCLEAQQLELRRTLAACRLAGGETALEVSPFSVPAGDVR